MVNYGHFCEMKHENSFLFHIYTHGCAGSTNLITDLWFETLEMKCFLSILNDKCDFTEKDNLCL